MNHINIDQPTPTEPGTYLWRGGLTGSIELLRVYSSRAQTMYGVDWLPCLVVRGRHVGALSGLFSKRLNETAGGLEEAV